MSTAFLVAAILAIGWNLTIAAAVFLTDAESARRTTAQQTTEQRTMRWTRTSVQAEIGRPTYDARTAAQPGGDAETPTQTPSRVACSSQTVAVDVRYADASVPVLTDEGRQLRHCSICMN